LNSEIVIKNLPFSYLIENRKPRKLLLAMSTDGKKMNIIPSYDRYWQDFINHIHDSTLSKSIEI